MGEVKVPRCGRIVHYFTVMPSFLKGEPSHMKLPAMVVLGDALHVHLKVFSVLDIMSELNVPHLSIVDKNENGEPKVSYWDWPDTN